MVIKRKKIYINIESFVLIIVASTLLVFLAFSHAITDENVSCASFKTQPEAQENYQTNLDGDSDGIACEALPSH